MKTFFVTVTEDNIGEVISLCRQMSVMDKATWDGQLFSPRGQYNEIFRQYEARPSFIDSYQYSPNSSLWDYVCPYGWYREACEFVRKHTGLVFK